MPSITASHDTPVARDTAPSHSTSSSTVEPSTPNAFTRPMPTSCPRTPPAVCWRFGAAKCSVASPELVAIVTSTPASLSHAEPRGEDESPLRNNLTPASTTRIGNRYADTPNSRNATSAKYAPHGPIRFETVPFPEYVNAGSDGS